MRNQNSHVVCSSITEIAQITSQIQALERRARDLNVSDLAHLLGVAEIAANDWMSKKLEEMEKTPDC